MFGRKKKIPAPVFDITMKMKKTALLLVAAIHRLLCFYYFINANKCQLH